MYERFKTALKLYEGKEPTLDGLVSLIGILISETRKRGTFSNGDWSDFFINLGSIMNFLNIKFDENKEKLQELSDEKSRQLIIRQEETLKTQIQIVELKRKIDEAEIKSEELITSRKELELLLNRKEMIEKELALYSEENRSKLKDKCDELRSECEEKRSEFNKISDNLKNLNEEYADLDMQLTTKEKEYECLQLKKNEYMELVSITKELEDELIDKEQEKNKLKDQKMILESQRIEAEKELTQYGVFLERITLVIDKFEHQQLSKEKLQFTLPGDERLSNFAEISAWLKKKLNITRQQVNTIREVTSELIDKAEQRIPE